jgi:hypothetical protein
MEKPVTVTVFPKLNVDSCGTSCGVSCNSCSGCDSNCGFTQSEEESMNDLYFALEEIGFKKCTNCKVDFVNTSDIDYSIERLNMVLVTSGKSTVTHYTYGEYMNQHAPIIALNSNIISEGKIPSKEELDKAFAKYA